MWIQSHLWKGPSSLLTEFHLPDGRIFVAFRGTDSTILGWKEDFELSFKETEAQKRARSYLAGDTQTY
jgi:hypothetical protein